jgi:hypothetical protein
MSFCPDFRSRFSGGSVAAKSTSLRQTKRTLRRFVGQELFRLRMHGRYELKAGTVGFPGHSISRITCSNLAEADDDFAYPYSQVII